MLLLHSIAGIAEKIEDNGQGSGCRPNPGSDYDLSCSLQVHGPYVSPRLAQILRVIHKIINRELIKL